MGLLVSVCLSPQCEPKQSHEWNKQGNIAEIFVYQPKKCAGLRESLNRGESLVSLLI